ELVGRGERFHGTLERRYAALDRAVGRKLGLIARLFLSERLQGALLDGHQLLNDGIDVKTGTDAGCGKRHSGSSGVESESQAVSFNSAPLIGGIARAIASTSSDGN